jgi:hypothetical protein
MHVNWFTSAAIKIFVNRATGAGYFEAEANLRR